MQTISSHQVELNNPSRSPPCGPSPLKELLNFVFHRGILIPAQNHQLGLDGLMRQ
jgi:hypothetical protein